jgi:hypothetical protein
MISADSSQEDELAARPGCNWIRRRLVWSIGRQRRCGPRRHPGKPRRLQRGT